MRLIVPLLVFALASGGAAQELALSIQAPSEAIHLGDFPKFLVTITNNGKKPVSLVQPGDGSEWKKRTPVIGWSVLPADGLDRKHPDGPPLRTSPRCGNINAFKANEVFALKAGASKQLDGEVGQPRFATPGKFRVVFYYQNIPGLDISGIPLGKHDVDTLKKIKQSYACSLVSNEILVDVLPKQQL